MSVNNRDVFDKASTTQAQGLPFGNQETVAQGTATAQPTQGFQQGRNGSFFWGNLAEIGGVQINTTPTSLAVVGLHKAFQEYLNDTLEQGITVELIPLEPKAIPNLGVSVIVLAVWLTEQQNNPKRTIGFHTYIVEGSIEPLRSRRRPDGREQVDVMVLTSDAYDRTMMNTLNAVMKQRFPQANLFACDAEVINRGFDASDKEAIGPVIQNGVLAARIPLQMEDPNFQDLNVACGELQGGRLVQEVRFSNQMEKDALGAPVRADIVTEMSFVPPTDNDTIFEQGRSLLTRSTAFVELAYDPLVKATEAVAGLWGQPAVTHVNPQILTYRPIIVATSLVSTKLQTLPATLLAFLNMSYLAENDLWKHALRPRHTAKGKPEVHDIGAIGYDIKPNGKAERIVTTPDKFSQNDFNWLLANTFHPGVSLAIDVPEAGPSTYYLGVIARAATGDIAARQMIHAAMDTLTNGHFSKCYADLGGNGTFFNSENNRIHTGFYNGENGEPADIRDLDYLAVANLAGDSGQLQIIADYTNSHNNTNISIYRRLVTRQMIQASMLSGLTYTGFAIRAIAEAAFIEAGKRALALAGYHVQPETPYTDNNVDTRANAGYVNGTILSNAHSSVFRQAYHGGGQFNQNAHIGRWS